MRTLRVEVIEFLEETRIKESENISYLFIARNYTNNEGYFYKKNNWFSIKDIDYQWRFIVSSIRKPKSGDVLQFDYQNIRYFMLVDGVIKDKKINKIYSVNEFWTKNV